MKNRKVFLGRDEQDQEILVAMELQLDSKQVVINTFPRTAIDEDFIQAMTSKWEEGETVEFPSEPTVISRSADEEHLLPDSIKTDSPEMIRRLKNEWTLRLLSVRLFENINDSITTMEAKIGEAEGYTQELWDQAKSLWGRVGEYSKENDLSRKHTGELRDRLNGIFDQLKEKRNSSQEEFEKTSQKVREGFENKLNEIRESIQNEPKLNELFDGLKKLQKEIKDAKLSHRDRRGLWKVLDNTFSKVKAEKQTLWASHLGNRLKGLEHAIGKMESSIKRDEDSLAFQRRKLEDRGVSQIESQLRATKAKVIEDRIKSKQNKLSEMQQTLRHLLDKRAKYEAEQAKRAASEAQTVPGATSTADDLLNEAAAPVESAARSTVVEPELAEAASDREKIPTEAGSEQQEASAEAAAPVAEAEQVVEAVEEAVEAEAASASTAAAEAVEEASDAVVEATESVADSAEESAQEAAEEVAQAAAEVADERTPEEAPAEEAPEEKSEENAEASAEDKKA